MRYILWLSELLLFQVAGDASFRGSRQQLSVHLGADQGCVATADMAESQEAATLGCFYSMVKTNYYGITSLQYEDEPLDGLSLLETEL